MLPFERTDILIVYGVARVTSDDVAVADGSVDSRLPHFVIRPGTTPPLRLNNAPYEISAAPNASGVDEARETLRYLQAHFRKFVDLWTKRQHTLLDRYAEFVEAETTAHRAELEALLARFGTLYGWRDWAFSALRPMPRAHVLAGDLTAAIAASRPFDMVFWTGDGLVALKTAGATAAAGPGITIDVIEIPDTALEAPAAEGLGPLLPDAFHRFWEGQALPTGPFRPGFPPAPPASGRS